MSDKFVSKFSKEEINFSNVEASIDTFCARWGLFQKSLSFIQYLNLLTFLLYFQSQRYSLAEASRSLKILILFRTSLYMH